MAEQPQSQLNQAKRRQPEASSPEPVLSRYAHLSAVGDDATPTMDVDSRELPADQGPEKLSPVERLPSQLHANPRPNKRTSFWKRITMPRVHTEPADKPPSPPISLEPVLNRMLGLEKQIAANQSATELRIEQFEENRTNINSVEWTKDNDDLRFRKGQLDVIALVLTLRDQVESLYEQNDV